MSRSNCYDRLLSNLGVLFLRGGETGAKLEASFVGVSGASATMGDGKPKKHGLFSDTVYITVGDPYKGGSKGKSVPLPG